MSPVNRFLSLAALVSMVWFSNCSEDSPKPVIEFMNTTSNALEGSTITVAFTLPLPGGVTPQVSFGGTATENDDFTYAVSSAGLVFTLIDDGIYDPDEIIIITLTGFAGNALVGTTITHTLTIKETPLVIEFLTQSNTRVEGTQLIVSYNQTLPAGVVPTFTISGTATITDDFTYTQGSNGFVFTIKQDEIYDPNETIRIELTGISGNAVLGAKKVYTITITDEDENTTPGLRINLSWDTGGGSAGDVDMDLLLWIETSPGTYEAKGSLWSAEIGTVYESTFIPTTETNGKWGISYVYYSGSSDNLKVNVSFRSFKGNINGTKNRASFNVTYTLANINPYDQTDVYIVEQTFTKDAGNYTNLTNIVVPSSGSRMAGIKFIVDEKYLQKRKQN